MSKKYKINEVARFLGVSPSAIRFYEKKGLLSVAKNEENGYRTFDERDIYVLWSIIFHRNIDVSVEDIYRLKHSDSLADIYDMVQHQKSDALQRMEAERRKLATWEYYEQLADRAMRCDHPRVIKTCPFHLFQWNTFYDRRHTLFSCSTLGYRFSLGEAAALYCEKEFSLVFDEDIPYVASADMKYQEEEIPPFLALSAPVVVEGAFNEEKALQLALGQAESLGYRVKPPYYVIYLLSTGDWEHSYYEAFLPLAPESEENTAEDGKKA